MVIRLQCPACRTSCEVDGRFAGQYGECPTCGAKVLIPAAPAARPSRADLSPAATEVSGTSTVLQILLALVIGAGAAFGLYWCFEHYPRGSAPPLRFEAGGKLHPLLVHLPIGFVFSAAILEIFTGRWRRHSAAVTGLLWLSLLSGIPAVYAGYFLGVSGEHNAETLDLHQWTGIAVPALALCALTAKLIHNLKPSMATGIYRIPLLGATASVILAGFFGGKLTHGSDTTRNLMILLSGQTPDAAGPAVPLEERTVYEAAIAPVLAEKCVSCHGEDKKKGQLQLHTLDAMLKAGDSEKPAVVPGNSAGSEAIVRILLPVDSDEHMPPDGKPQLTEDEIAVFRWWIDDGAKGDVKVRDAGVPGDLLPKFEAIASAPRAETPKAPESEPDMIPAETVTPQDAAAVEQIEKELGVVILPVSQSDAALTFNCVNVADRFGDAELAKFAPIAARLTELNLSRSKVTDAGLATVAAMTHLRKLHLENTAITDAGLEALLSLGNLEYLNLFNTKVTDAGIARLEAVKSLKRLYVWQTEVTEEGARALHAKLPDIVINLGWDKEVKTAQAPPPAAAEQPAATAVTGQPAEVDPAKPVYEALIAPVLADKCAGCHGEEKQKGKLAVHTIEALLKGGDGGAAIVAGKSAESLLVQRIVLPLESDEHMPPEGKPQLSEKEIELLKWWIDSGAKTDVAIQDAGIPDSLK